MKRFLIHLSASVLFWSMANASLASTTYLTCINNAYVGPATGLSAAYQKDPYNIVGTYRGEIWLSVDLWNSVYYAPSYVFSSQSEAYGFCAALRSECQHRYPESKGQFQAWNNLSGVTADIYVKMLGEGPAIQDGGGLCNTVLSYPPDQFALDCADSDGRKPSGMALQQDIEKYRTLIQNKDGSTWLTGTMQPSSGLFQAFALSGVFNTEAEADNFCQTVSAQCKRQFPKGNGSVSVSAFNSFYPLSVTFRFSGTTRTANCPYFFE
jgi:hypothetical protein